MSISFYVGYGSKASESRGCLPVTLLAKLQCGCTGIESRCKGKFLGHSSFILTHPCSPSREGDGYRKETTLLAWWRKYIYAKNWFSQTLMQLPVLPSFTPKGAPLPHLSTPTEDTTFAFCWCVSAKNITWHKPMPIPCKSICDNLSPCWKETVI